MLELGWSGLRIDRLGSMLLFGLFPAAVGSIMRIVVDGVYVE